MKKTGNIVLGSLLIIIGVIIATNSLGITHIDIFFKGWWTLFIIIPCFIGIFNDHDKTGNIIGLIVGVMLLLMCHGVLDFGKVWKLLWPTILILIGISIIFKDVMGGKIAEDIKRLNEKRGKENEYCATFSGQNLKCTEEFKGADLTAVFGGIDYDLKNSIISEDVVINASSTFGGITIYVPEDVKVKIKSTSIFGGVSDKKKHNEQTDSHTIYINAKCLFGGVDIK